MIAPKGFALEFLRFRIFSYGRLAGIVLSEVQKLYGRTESGGPESEIEI